MLTRASVSADDEIGLVIGGADAVLSAEMETEDMVRRLETVQGGGAVVPPDRLRALLERVRHHRNRVTSREDLTMRERQILASIDRGESVKQTARALGISPKTVENLQSRLFSKMDVRNRAQAISHAHDLSLLDEEADPPAEAPRR
jgi:DNA-binding NarL/FixJ family response regulator